MDETDRGFSDLNAAVKDEEEAEFRKLERKLKHPVLKGFAQYLFDEGTSADEIEALIAEGWNGHAYPENFAGDDLLISIGSFLYNMGEFAVGRIIKNSFPKVGGRQLYIRTVADPSYEDNSHVYIIESTTRTLLAEGCGCKSWMHDPDAIADDLLSLESQLKSGWRLAQKRVLALNMLGSPADLPLKGTP